MPRLHENRSDAVYYRRGRPIVWTPAPSVGKWCCRCVRLLRKDPQATCKIAKGNLCCFHCRQAKTKCVPIPMNYLDIAQEALDIAVAIDPVSGPTPEQRSRLNTATYTLHEATKIPRTPAKRGRQQEQTERQTRSLSRVARRAVSQNIFHVEIPPHPLHSSPPSAPPTPTPTPLRSPSVIPITPPQRPVDLTSPILPYSASPLPPLSLNRSSSPIEPYSPSSPPLIEQYSSSPPPIETQDRDPEPSPIHLCCARSPTPEPRLFRGLSTLPPDSILMWGNQKVPHDTCMRFRAALRLARQTVARVPCTPVPDLEEE